MSSDNNTTADKPCKKCRGKGFYRVAYETLESDPIACPDCNATGKAPDQPAEGFDQKLYDRVRPYIDRWVGQGGRNADMKYGVNNFMTGQGMKMLHDFLSQAKNTAVPDQLREQEDCVFCQKIANGETTTDGTVAYFEPLNPVTPGHLLVVPVKHVANITDDPETTAQVMRTVSYMSKDYEALNVITSKGADATQTVFHFHVHLVPRRKDDGLLLPWSNQLRAHSALNNGSKQAESTLANPEPVESLEATVIDCLDSARKGDDPNALGYYLMGEIDIALQKARIEGAAKFVEEGWGKRCKTKDLEDFPELTHDPKGSRCGTCEMWEHYDEWVKELREESNT